MHHSNGIFAQTSGEYSEALDNCHGASNLETAFNDYGYLFCKISIIYAINGK
ncbi:hypothetical protein [cyanobacterium endosymbiont of Epithemia turgida]|uniref:hypothetical protein n=1 Tax=cyanobacterium endosymbiont of Epithemia turgida TaxID=718217 RepID=UPI001493F22A|nr:hypothetical protein [cyanobacterium endosymbiont of Epithemia turgida]